MPTASPMTASSATAFAAASLSLTRRHVEFVHVADGDRERPGRAAGVAAGRPDGDVVRCGRLAVDATGHRDHARIGVDREPPARVVVERVADRIGPVRIVGEGRHADHRAGSRVLQDEVGRTVGVADGRDTRLVDVRYADREHFGGERPVGARRPHRDRVAAGRLVVEAAGDGHHARVGVDREQPAGIVIQRVADRVRGIGIGRQAGDTHHGARRRILGNGVGTGIGVGHGPGVEFVDVTHGDRQGRRY